MPSGPNRVLAVLVAAVVLFAVVAGVVVANREPPDVDPRSAQGVVQAYLQAVFDGDYARAAKLLAQSSGCEQSDLESAAYVSDSARIVLDDAVVNGDHAVVTVDVTEGTGDELLGDSGYSHTERITLERETGIWKITGSPWLLPACSSEKG